ncbi:MAG TPA: DUF6249 domain-containing protein [Gammaproteobacteria bacterium]
MNTDKLLVRVASLAVLLLAVTLSFTVNPEALAEPVMQVQTDPSGETQKIIEEAIGWHLDSNTGPFAVAIVSIVGVFIAPAVVAIIVVWLVFRNKGKKEEMKFDTLKLMVEKGVPIPDNFSFADPAPDPGYSLRRGLILIALGIGIAVFFLLVNAPEAVGLSAIPFFIGLAYLLIWYIERNKDPQSGKRAV